MKKKINVTLTLEYVYKNYLASLISLAKQHIYNPDYSIDAVQNAFLIAHKYAIKNPDKGINPILLRWGVKRACKKLNRRFNREIPYGDTRYMTDVTMPNNR